MRHDREWKKNNGVFAVFIWFLLVYLKKKNHFQLYYTLSIIHFISSIIHPLNFSHVSLFSQLQDREDQVQPAVAWRVVYCSCRSRSASAFQNSTACPCTCSPFPMTLGRTSGDQHVQKFRPRVTVAGRPIFFLGYCSLRSPPPPPFPDCHISYSNFRTFLTEKVYRGGPLHHSLHTSLLTLGDNMTQKELDFLDSQDFMSSGAGFVYNPRHTPPQSQDAAGLDMGLYDHNSLT